MISCGPFWKSATSFLPLPWMLWWKKKKPQNNITTCWGCYVMQCTLTIMVFDYLNISFTFCKWQSHFRFHKRSHDTFTVHTGLKIPAIFSTLAICFLYKSCWSWGPTRSKVLCVKLPLCGAFPSFCNFLLPTSNSRRGRCVISVKIMVDAIKTCSRSLATVSVWEKYSFKVMGVFKDKRTDLYNFRYCLSVTVLASQAADTNRYPLFVVKQYVIWQAIRYLNIWSTQTVCTINYSIATRLFRVVTSL